MGRERISSGPGSHESPNVIFNTGNGATWPKPTWMLTGGNRRSHCTSLTGAYVVRDAGSVITNDGSN